MAEKRPKSETEPSHGDPNDSATGSRLPREYRRAGRLAKEGRSDEARRLYGKLGERETTSGRLRALARNDTAVMEVMAGRRDAACVLFREALELDASCEPARLNLAVLLSEGEEGERRTAELAFAGGVGAHPNLAPPSQVEENSGSRISTGESSDRRESRDRTKVAILSFLFNWPSTGGGNVHTVELAQFLARAGYEVRHIYARYPALGDRPRRGAAFRSRARPSSSTMRSWNVAAIQARFRRAVDAFEPDYVLITDSWNMKPILAEAVRGYPYFLRFQALECLCPLNNLRLLAEGPDQVEQCPRNQLATPEDCRRCLDERGQHSGQLHQLRAQPWPGSGRRSTTGRCAGRWRGRGGAGPQPADRGDARARTPGASASSPGAWTRRGSPGRRPSDGRGDRRADGGRHAVHGGGGGRVDQGLPRRCTRPAGCSGRRGPTSSWSSPPTRRAGSMSSRAPSAGARRRNCRGITGPPTSAWCRRSPRRG